MNNKKDFNYEEFRQQAIAKIKQGKGISGKDGVFTLLIKEFLESALSEELSSHLLNEREENDDLQNKKNGYSTKTIKSDIGQFEIDTPRDRDGSFEPQIIKKRQTILTEDLDNKIISLYAGGMSYSSISSHIRDMYGIEISR
jgi:transposase-like protein